MVVGAKFLFLKKKKRTLSASPIECHRYEGSYNMLINRNIHFISWWQVWLLFLLFFYLLPLYNQLQTAKYRKKYLH